ncbi:MAG: Ulp1 protease [Hyperionvirus sp.]|uniref:Ulp1 protease n=1 Tax=Hyperionvirus sp. TaxID=2487770 RepID=A0A3G5AAI2_9VIRU|nr:MAG: Ulp1 protease [Hyperionvirus sp.]
MRDDIDSKCAPGKMFEDGSCIPLNILLEMAGAYNLENPGDGIKLYPSFETLNRSKYKKYLLNEFNRRLNGVCKTQVCWTKQSFVARMTASMQDELKRKTFRPEGPNGKFEWLNTVNINEVVSQYELKYRDFKFLGAVPIDFDELPKLGLKNLKMDRLVGMGKTKLGVVFNLDESWKAGSHWVAVYSDLLRGYIYYFDSYGMEPENRIRKFMRRIANFCQGSLGCRQIIAEHNRVRHQYGGSECGVYSINFILRLLRGDSFEKVCESKVPDSIVNQCRRIYFK